MSIFAYIMTGGAAKVLHDRPRRPWCNRTTARMLVDAKYLL